MHLLLEARSYQLETEDSFCIDSERTPKSRIEAPTNNRLEHSYCVSSSPLRAVETRKSRRASGTTYSPHELAPRIPEKKKACRAAPRRAAEKERAEARSRSLGGGGGVLLAGKHINISRSK